MTETTAHADCQMGVAPFFQCCCNCRLLLTDHKHCSVDGRTPDGGCICSEVKGYICTAFADEGKVTSGWPLHSCGCELYWAREPKVKEDAINVV